MHWSQSGLLDFQKDEEYQWAAEDQETVIVEADFEQIQRDFEVVLQDK